MIARFRVDPLVVFALRAPALRLPPWLLAAALASAWLLAAPSTPDLAAQVYRAGLYASGGFAVWDDFWFAGHHLPGYSLLFPPLGAMLGPRVAGAITALIAAVLFDRLARGHFGERARAGTAWFAAASIADLCIGRLTFSLGVAIGLGALLAWQRGRTAVAVALAVACGAGSPIAGAFLALAGSAVALAAPRERVGRQGAAIAVAAFTTVLALALAFPEGGRQPFAFHAMLPVVGFSAALVALLPARERVLRIGAGLYALAGLAAFLVPTPMGSNATRLGATFAGPLLVCALAGSTPAPRRRRLVLVLATALVAWQWYAPAREITISAGDPSTHAAYYRGLTAFLARHARAPGRVEVPFTRAHWEAVYLARRFPLARGWETQLDTKYNALFFRHRGVGVNSYRSWLRRNGVRFVAVPDAPLDPAGRAEARLIALGVPYLRPVWRDAHWRVYAMTAPLALATGAARIVAFQRRGFVLEARRAGWIGVRVHYTPYWQTAGAPACVSTAPGGWTRIYALAPGRIRVRARFAAGRVMADGPSCRRVATTKWG